MCRLVDAEIFEVVSVRPGGRSPPGKTMGNRFSIESNSADGAGGAGYRMVNKFPVFKDEKRPNVAR